MPMCGGTGLGLYISLGIAAAHDGTIRAYSGGVDQGATFTLELPIAGPNASDTTPEL